MKKIFYSILILIFILGISTTCFGAKGFTEAEFSELMEAFGYGPIDLDEYTFNYDSLSGFKYELSSTSRNLIICKWGSNKTTKSYDPNKFLFRRVSSDLNFLDYDSYFTIDYAMNGNGIYIFDTLNKTVDKLSSSASASTKVPFYFWRENNEVTDDEWNSSEFQKNLLDSFLLYSENKVFSSNGTQIFSHLGGAIKNLGSISYGNTTKTVSLSLSNSLGSSFDLFLERYNLDNSLETGVQYYPLESINLGKINASDTSISLDLSKYVALSSKNIYRLCVGTDTFDSLGYNNVLSSTDWLLPNSNTLIKYPIFASRHYYQFLSLVGFNPDYTDSPEDTETPSGDISDSSNNIEPYFYNNLSGFYSSTTSPELFLKVVDVSNNYVDINNFFIRILIKEVVNDADDKIIGAWVIDSGDLWTNENYNSPFYTIKLPDYYTFSGDNFVYQVRLFDYDNNLIDKTSDFYFDENIVPSGNDDDNLWDLIKRLPTNIINGIAGIFIPKSGFFSNYFNEFNNWFSDRLGILYFPFDFIISFFNRIYNAEFNEPIIVIPAMQIPLFEEYGNIYNGTTFNFREFIDQHETFKYIYNLYLVCVDGIIIWNLIRLLMKKYEEVTTNGN